MASPCSVKNYILVKNLATVELGLSGVAPRPPRGGACGWPCSASCDPSDPSFILDGDVVPRVGFLHATGSLCVRALGSFSFVTKCLVSSAAATAEYCKVHGLATAEISLLEPGNLRPGCPQGQALVGVGSLAHGWPVIAGAAAVGVPWDVFLSDTRYVWVFHPSSPVLWHQWGL